MLVRECILIYGKNWIRTLRCTLVQPLHYILKCNNLEWRWFIWSFYIYVNTNCSVYCLILIISIPNEELFSETAVGCIASYFVSKLYLVPVGSPPPPSFDAVYCFICGRRRVAVARYQMIRLALVWCFQRYEWYSFWSPLKLFFMISNRIVLSHWFSDLT